MTKPIAIHWFRQDLRLQDNPALQAAVARGRVLPVYILDEVNPARWQPGAASRWWLQHSLQRLNESLQGKLWVLQGDSNLILPRLAISNRAAIVTWNRCYEPWSVQLENRLKTKFRRLGIDAPSSNGSLLFEPGNITKNDGTPYKVFTPFYKQTQTINTLAAPPLESCRSIDLVECLQGADKIDRLELMPDTNWYGGLQRHWTPGEHGAHERLQVFVDEGLQDYRKGRDYPAQQSVSRLSPHLNFGEISPRQVLASVQQSASLQALEQQAEHFRRELIWREFSYSQLFHFPQLVTQNLKPHFDRFPWRQDKTLLEAWQRGETGYPLVDAGMRELWQTGYMHNRVRMIVASFLVKNLMIHWSEGASWFWDCLVDADLANNSCSWQWVAGSGSDAAPYFRIFNPVTQSLRFDADASYIKHFVPELEKLPLRYIHDPSSAPEQELTRAGLKLGRDYPQAIVDLQQSRKDALAAYKTLTR